MENEKEITLRFTGDSKRNLEFIQTKANLDIGQAIKESLQYYAVALDVVSNTKCRPIFMPGAKGQTSEQWLEYSNPEPITIDLLLMRGDAQ